MKAKIKKFKFHCPSCGDSFIPSDDQFQMWIDDEIESTLLCPDCEFEQSNFEFSDSYEYSDADPGL